MEISRLVGQKTQNEYNSADAGGICGYNNGTPMEACINNGDINVEYNMTIHVGGISGDDDSWSYTSVDDTSISTIIESTNNGNLKGISTQKDCYIAGIAGRSDVLTVIDNSINNGTVEGKAQNGTVYDDNIVGARGE